MEKIVVGDSTVRVNPNADYVACATRRTLSDVKNVQLHGVSDVSSKTYTAVSLH